MDSEETQSTFTV